MNSSTTHFDPNLFIPDQGVIKAISQLTPRESYFRVKLNQPMEHIPGQFVMVSIPGVGEAPISIACGPHKESFFEMVIRNVGSLTRVLHGLRIGDVVGVRGPFGSGFDLDDFYGKDVLLVAGGLGLAPLRSLIQPLMAESHRFGRIKIITGFRTPAEELFRDESARWFCEPNVEVIKMVNDTAHLPWDGEVGLVTEPIKTLDIDVTNCVVALVGPPVMYKFVVIELVACGFNYGQIYVDLERRMKCGIGKCGHCQINHLYCCQQGPVFRLSDLQSVEEAFT